jgi:tripartite-type tricarboxylate transporter receptor subunit TctC
MGKSRLLWLAAALLASGLLSAGAGAQGYPSRAVHILVGFPPGGPNDTLARLVGERLGKAWAQPVVVENRPGASGTLALEALTRSAPDGHTLAMLTLNHVVAAELMPKLAFSLAQDFTPIVGVARQGNVLVVHPAVPARNAAELIAWLKERPGKASYASGGNGSPAHVAGELFKMMTGVDMVHVPYKGAAPGLQDVVAGHVQLMFAAAPPALPLVRSGKLRALAVTSNTRAAHSPELPTLAESGIDYDVRDWQGFVGPRALPRDIVERINAEVVKALQQSEMRERIAGMGGEATGGTPAEFAAHIAAESAKWRAVVRKAGISIN